MTVDTLVNFTEAEIRPFFTANALSAGALYCQQLRVQAFERNGDIISAKVQGNELKAYRQSILVEREGGRLRISSSCTCPIGFNCKHVAAALFEHFQRRSNPSYTRSRPLPAVIYMPPEKSPPPPALVPAPPRPARPPAPREPDALPPDLAGWLQRLEQAVQPDSEAYLASTPGRLLYLLAPSWSGAGTPNIKVEFVTVRVLKSGGYSSSTGRFHPEFDTLVQRAETSAALGLSDLPSDAPGPVPNVVELGALRRRIRRRNSAADRRDRARTLARRDGPAADVRRAAPCCDRLALRRGRNHAAVHRRGRRDRRVECAASAICRSGRRPDRRVRYRPRAQAHPCAAERPGGFAPPREDARRENDQALARAGRFRSGRPRPSDPHRGRAEAGPQAFVRPTAVAESVRIISAISRRWRASRSRGWSSATKRSRFRSAIRAKRSPACASAAFTK